MIAIHRSAVPLSFESLSDLPEQKLEHDWFGRPVPAPFHFTVAIDGEMLWFAARRDAAPVCDPARRKGEFVEGLWMEEAAELFLCADSGPGYLEFNLAPSGAWWWCAFSGYRVRQPLPAPTGTLHAGSIGPNGWAAAIAVPRSVLPIPISFGPASRANVCGVLINPERFFSAARFSAEQPDFHLAAEFPAIHAVASRPT